MSPYPVLTLLPVNIELSHLKTKIKVSEIYFTFNTGVAYVYSNQRLNKVVQYVLARTQEE